MTGEKDQKVSRGKASSHAKHWHASDALRRALLASALISVAVTVLVLVALSPLALRQLGFIRGVHWSQLSNIGQTYGAASALLTGLALIGVVGSMVFQVRAIKVSREQAMREQHAHLVEMALTDPIYQRAWGGLYDAYGSTDRYRQHGYINLIVSFWQNNYVLGGSSDQVLRGVAASMFRGEAGRDFWADTSDMRLQSAEGGRNKRFCQIMEEEYQKAISTGPPAIEAEEPSSKPAIDHHNTLHNPMIKKGLTLACGAIGGIALQALVRSRNK